MSAQVSGIAAKIQALIDAGRTPETEPALRGFVKAVAVASVVPAPGKQFAVCQAERLMLVPDLDAIAARLRAKSYGAKPSRCGCPARKFQPDMPCKHMLQAQAEWDYQNNKGDYENG